MPYPGKERQRTYQHCTYFRVKPDTFGQIEKLQWGVSRTAAGASEEEVGTPQEVLLGRARWAQCPPEVPCNEI